MTHNFSITFYSASDEIEKNFDTQAQNLDDALITLYEAHEDAIYIKHDVDINPAAFEPESDTIKAAIESRNK